MRQSVDKSEARSHALVRPHSVKQYFDNSHQHQNFLTVLLFAYLLRKAISNFANELSPLALLGKDIGQSGEVRLATADATVRLQHEVEVTGAVEVTDRPGHCL